MERTTVEEAKKLFGHNFIGKNELLPLFEKLNLFDFNKVEIPAINYSFEELNKYSKDYILILGVSSIQNTKITIKLLKDIFGFDPDVFDPCFYNQDWYLKEDFINETLEDKWYLIKKVVYEETRAELPENIFSNQHIKFPTAILCTYVFFAYYLYYNKILWANDFVWCSNQDHNGDRIYVGKYYDIDKINKNGFSIHRYLSLRQCYAGIDYIG